MAIELLEVIYNRSSCRNFLDKPIEEWMLENLLEAMRRAPSAGNIQPWHFFAILNQKIKNKLANAAYGQGFIAKAPVVFVVCVNPIRSSLGYGKRGRSLYCIQDAAAATENLLIAAEAMGLAGCWVGAFNEEKAAKVLNLTSYLRPVAIVPIGYPVQKRGPTHKNSVEKVTTIIR